MTFKAPTAAKKLQPPKMVRGRTYWKMVTLKGLTKTLTSPKDVRIFYVLTNPKLCEGQHETGECHQHLSNGAFNLRCIKCDGDELFSDFIWRYLNLAPERGWSHSKRCIEFRLFDIFGARFFDVSRKKH